MKSMQGKPLGAALAAACVAIALTACASVRTVSADHSPTSSPTGSASLAAGRPTSAVGQPTSVTGQTLRQRAEADAAAILTSFAAPPGGHRLAVPPNVPGGVLDSPASYLGATWEVHLTGFWEAPGDPQALLAWEQGRLTPRFTLGDAGFGPPVWDRGFQLASEGALTTRELDVAVASAGDGQTGIRVDAWVAWQPPRPATSLIPATARTVTIAELPSGEVVAPGGATAKPLPAPVTITDPAAVRGIATLIDGLPLSTIPPDSPCPATIGPFLSLTFRARPGGPALATVQTDQSCDGVTLTVRGKQQPALENEPTLDGRILKLATLPWQINPVLSNGSC
jgi:hypothetical protein